MAEHEPCIGATDDWYTPRHIFDALGLIFDLDPCSPGPTHWVPARKIYMKEDDGLVQPWSGTVFMNPPFGRRNGHVPWLPSSSRTVMASLLCARTRAAHGFTNGL